MTNQTSGPSGSMPAKTWDDLFKKEWRNSRDVDAFDNLISAVDKAQMLELSRQRLKDTGYTTTPEDEMKVHLGDYHQHVTNHRPPNQLGRLVLTLIAAAGIGLTGLTGVTAAGGISYMLYRLFKTPAVQSDADTTNTLRPFTGDLP